MNWIRIISLIFISAVSGINVWGQNYILVLDEQSKEPVPYAHLSFESFDSGEKHHAVSNHLGTAQFNIASSGILKVSYTGFIASSDTLNPGENTTVYLKSDLLNLNQVVVTATRTPKRLKDVPVLTQVLLEEEIASRGITEMDKLLEYEIPGIEFHQAGFGADIKMQGLDATYVLFLLDGERMAGETEGNIDYNRINMNDIARFEIVKGAASALYGSQAMGGVINMISKRPVEKFELNIGGKLKQYNQINYENVKSNDDFYDFKKNLDLPNLNLHATLGMNLDRLLSKTNFNFTTTDAYNLKSTDTLVQVFNEYDLVIKEVTETNISGTKGYSVSQLFEYMLTDKLVIHAYGSYYNNQKYDFKRDNIFEEFTDFTYRFKATYQMNEKSRLEATYNDDVYKKFDVSEVDQSRTNHYINHFYNPRLIYYQNFGEKHEFIAGGEYLIDELSTTMFDLAEENLEKVDSKTGIAFIQDDYKINSKFSVVGGLRLDYHSTFGGHVSPKLSLMYKWIPLTFRFNYANSFRSPTLKELFLNWDHIGIFYIKGNPDLVPETNNYFSLSTEYNRSNFNSSLNIYQNWFKNKIDGYWSIAEDGKQQWNYENIAKSDIFGIELLFKYRINKNFFVSGGYSYINDSKEFENDNVSTVAPHSGNMRVEYAYSSGIYNLRVNLSGKVTGKKEYHELTEIEINDQQEVASYPAEYEAFTMWNLAVSQTFHNGLSLVIGVDNLFDYRAPLVNFNTTLSPGRRGYISLNMQLDHLYREFRAIIKK